MNELMRTTRIFFAPPDAPSGGGDGGGAALGGDGAAQAPADAAPAAPAADAAIAAAGEGAAAVAAADAALPAVDGHLLTDDAPVDEGDKPVADKPADDAADKDDAPKGAPEAYVDFALPEGVTVDAERMAGFQALAKELDLPQERAQQLVDFHVGEMRKSAAAPYQAWADTQTKWQSEVKADPELGGANFKETKRAAAALLTPGENNPFIKTAAEATAFREALEFTGMSNNPAMVRIARRVGMTLLEAGPVEGGKNPDAKLRASEVMYGAKSDPEA